MIDLNALITVNKNDVAEISITNGENGMFPSVEFGNLKIYGEHYGEESYNHIYLFLTKTIEALKTAWNEKYKGE
jgi:hypothetical protein